MMISKLSYLVIANLLSSSIAQTEPSEQGIKFVPHYYTTSGLTPVQQAAVNGHRLHQNIEPQSSNKKTGPLAKRDAQMGGGSGYNHQFQGGQSGNPYQGSQGDQMTNEGEEQESLQNGSGLQNISTTIPRASNVAVQSANSIPYSLSNEIESAITGVTPTATGAVQRAQPVNSSANVVPPSNSLVPPSNVSVNGTMGPSVNTSTLPPGITSIPTSDVASANLSQKASDMTRFTNGQIVPSDFAAEVSLSTTPSSAFTFMSPSLYTQTLQTVRNNQQEWYTLTRVTMVLVTSTPAGANSMMNTSATRSGNMAKETGRDEKGSKAGKDSTETSKGDSGSSESGTSEGEESGAGNSSSSGSETAAQNSGTLTSMMMSSTVLLLISGSFIFL
ncbi:hypothetical protein TRICI_003736 [Trichomonascus ciferrii]|uniref:Uncharacterized protein n=1 Tax=Trichomonascus ciferrii TaxID=44093 RepID=A0A642V497_9ASCO|nr:hypothetical protein TRICI_003736 [Trichomonascus ciferrii]